MANVENSISIFLKDLIYALSISRNRKDKDPCRALLRPGVHKSVFTMRNFALGLFTCAGGLGPFLGRFVCFIEDFRVLVWIRGCYVLLLWCVLRI